MFHKQQLQIQQKSQGHPHAELHVGEAASCTYKLAKVHIDTDENGVAEVKRSENSEDPAAVKKVELIAETADLRNKFSDRKKMARVHVDVADVPTPDTKSLAYDAAPIEITEEKKPSAMTHFEPFPRGIDSSNMRGNESIPSPESHPSPGLISTKSVRLRPLRIHQNAPDMNPKSDVNGTQNPAARLQSDVLHETDSMKLIQIPDTLSEHFSNKSDVQNFMREITRRRQLRPPPPLRSPPRIPLNDSMSALAKSTHSFDSNVVNSSETHGENST